MNAQLQNDWPCSSCANPDHGRSSNDDSKTREEPSSVDKLNNIQKMLTTLLPLAEKMELVLGMKQTIDSIESSVQMLSDKYDEFATRLNKQDQAINNLQKKVTEIEAGNAREEMPRLKKELNELQQYSRRQNLEVHGIQVITNENLLAVVNSVGESLGLQELTDSDIDSIHRLPSRPNRVPPIIIRFATRKMKEQWKAKAKLLRERESDVRFFENLTPLNKKLLYLARAKAVEIGYEFVWEHRGTVLTRKKPGNSAIKISTESDLEKMV
ncbi:hypothetical protein HPB49_012180 [Dermacentor silvarum]|uniref:Uncharacterized protein n=1 Tax=Dermacentor silvarum TaxID=543639 RepID=A0ACB8CL24_DERSI|nr:hypothetical protein HPB49_012180 [Dermacentor silvarum]